MRDQTGLDVTTDDEIGQNRGTGLADGASGAVVGHIGHGVAVELDPQRNFVAARRIDVVHLNVIRLPQAFVVRLAVVVEDDLLVHRFELHQPKNLFAFSSPTTNASISDGVVYR